MSAVSKVYSAVSSVYFGTRHNTLDARPGNSFSGARFRSNFGQMDNKLDKSWNFNIQISVQIGLVPS